MIQVNENRLELLLKELDRDKISVCPEDENGSVIDCPNWDDNKWLCSTCWRTHLTELPVPTEPLVMIKLVSDQLVINQELLK